MDPVKPGVAYLVGVGPGDPAMLTVRAVEILRRADVVFHGRLVNAEILALAKASRVVFTGRRPDGTVPSAEAVADDIAHAVRDGAVVAHLKNGDPLLFTATSEEMARLCERQVPFEVVPGVSSVFAAAAAVGLPLSAEGVTRSIALVDGHTFGREPSDWQRLGADTVLVLMAWARLHDVCRQLREAGWAGDTPAAVVSQVGRPDQRHVLGTLADVAGMAQATLSPPATLLVGAVLASRAVRG